MAKPFKLPDTELKELLGEILDKVNRIEDHLRLHLQTPITLQISPHPQKVVPDYFDLVKPHYFSKVVPSEPFS